MGQQQTVAGSTLLRRMVLALAVAAVMALLVMASAAPAFAAGRDKAVGPLTVEPANLVAQETTVNNLNEGLEPGKGGRDATANFAKNNHGIDEIASPVR